MAPAAGADRPRPDQPSRGPAMGDAPPQPGGDGPVGGGCGLSQADPAHRSMGHLQRQPGTAGALMEASPIREAGLWKRGVLWLLLLAPLFFGSYGFANGFSAQRDDVGSLVFAWEQQMPLWPWTIVPYWSIDLLYGLAFLLPASRREMDRHAFRLLAAQLICVACFLLWPLRFTFERPPLEGTFGLMFDVLMGFDKPFNQAPSLHIPLLVIIWAMFARHTRGVFLRSLLHAWMALIGVSV